MSTATPTDARWHDVMTGLLYPAVLGALLFTFFERISDLQSKAPAHFLLAGLALFILFTFDYSHTLDKHVKQTYGPLEFACDAILISLLFLAGKQVLNTPVFVAPLWALMFCAKAASGIWEGIRFSKAKASGASAKVSKNFISDCVFTAIYFVLGLFLQKFMPEYAWTIVYVMLADAAVYIWLTAA